MEGETEGPVDIDGCGVGCIVGSSEGSTDGFLEGLSEGTSEGCIVLGLLGCIVLELLLSDLVLLCSIRICLHFSF